jgi:hypothetical protein
MRFLVDAQLPPALATWLNGQGHLATHVFGLEFVSAGDRTILEKGDRDRCSHRDERRRLCRSEESGEGRSELASAGQSSLNCPASQGE